MAYNIGDEVILRGLPADLGEEYKSCIGLTGKIIAITLDARFIRKEAAVRVEYHDPAYHDPARQRWWFYISDIEPVNARMIDPDMSLDEIHLAQEVFSQTAG